MVIVTTITNPFKPVESRVSKEVEWSGKTLREYLPEYELKAALNGDIYPDLDTVVADGSHILIAPVLEGGGGDKNPLATVAMIALVVAAPMVAPALLGAGAGAFATSMITAATMAAGGMLINAVFPPSAPDLGNMGNSSAAESSPSYSWSGNQTMARVGTPIPVVYGKFSVSGNIISQRVEYQDDDEYLYMLLALCEGPINSISAEDIKVNGATIDKFQDTLWYTRTGVMNQSVIRGFGDIIVPVSFSVKCGYNTPVVKQTIGNAVEGLRLYINFPFGLFYANDNGGMDYRSVSFKVEYKEVGAAEWVYDNTYTVKSNRNTSVKKQIAIDNLARSEYEIRITKLTEDAATSREKNEMFWGGFGEVAYDDVVYPGIALLGLRIRATGQLSGGTPNISVTVSRTYAEVFDENGVNKGVKRIDNPAYTAYDLLTNKKYGGSIPFSNIDYGRFDEWASWCDELVDDGRGGLEKRAVFNGVIDFQSNIWEIVQKIAMVGRAGMTIRGTRYSPVVEKPTFPVQLFSMGNIVKGSMKVNYIGAEDLADECEVQFNSEQNNYTRDNISVLAPDMFSQTNVSKKTTLSLLGITKPSQAYRAGRFFLLCNKHHRRAIEFETGVDSIACTVGDVIYVAHDVPTWGNSGRIVSATVSSVTLDKKVQVYAGSSYKILIRLHDDTIIEHEISVSINEETDTFSLIQDFNTVPQKHDVYTFAEDTKLKQEFRIIDISRKDDQTAKIRAIDYNESVLTDTQTIIPTRSTSVIDVIPQVISQEISEHMEKRQSGLIVPYVDLAWLVKNIGVQGSLKSMVYLSKDGELFMKIAETSEFRYSYNAIDLEDGKSYWFKILCSGLNGVSESLESVEAVEYVYRGKTYPPSDVVNFRVSQNASFVNFSWDHIDDVDLRSYEIRRGIIWESATVVASGITADSYSSQTELNGTYRYLIKARDTSSILSKNAAVGDITLTGIDEQINIILSEDSMLTGAAGDRYNMAYLSQTPMLLNLPALLDTDVPDTETDLWDQTTDYTMDNDPHCTYTSIVYDTQKVGTTFIRIIDEVHAILTEAYDTTFDVAWTDKNLNLSDTDISITPEIIKLIEIRYSNYNIAFTPWIRYEGTMQQQFRYLQVRIDITTVLPSTRIEIRKLLCSLDVPDVDYSIKGVSVPAAGIDILHGTYGKQFYAETVVRVTSLDAGKSLVPDIVSKTVDGFHLDLYDSSDVKSAGTVDILITGY